MNTKLYVLTLILATLASASTAAATISSSGVGGALIAAGGGPGSFSTVRAFGSIVGSDATQSELTAIRNRSTTKARDRFIRTFDFAVADAWERAGQENVSIPDSAQRGRELGRALFEAGLQGGAFSGDAFFATLFTPKVWADVRRVKGGGRRTE